ncbi:hypothetical protein ACIQWN_38690 [Streptomyces vinaceus]|uniref:hypothetical protein n=1 Tax=Streptomyces vinaceus TaxID=1960 RepID=UPI0038011C77
MRECAKAAELTAAGHKASARAVGKKRRRYETNGVLGLADHRSVRRTPRYGAMDEAMVAAMQQAISEAVEAFTRTVTFLLWRTGEILKDADKRGPVPLPSRSTLYRLLDKLTAGTHTTAQ